MMRPSGEAVLREARRVLREEAQALEIIAQGLGEEFPRAVDLLAKCTGKIIVTGVGKSGLVGRKIASTIASLGSPAFFVHPTEAVHGDMGALDTKDIVLAVSHSGGTDELLAFLRAVREWFKVDIIVITGRRSGVLDELATVVLETRVTTEACAFGLTPTTSSTATLALGDALTVCVSVANGIGPKDFALRHPFGSLGRRLYARVSEMMHRDYIEVGAEMPLPEVVAEVTRGGLGMVYVDAGAGTKGIITDGDIRRAVQANPDWRGLKAQDVMSSPPIQLSEGSPAFEALTLMESRKITSLAIVDGRGAIMGVVHLHDLLGPLAKPQRSEENGPEAASEGS